MVEAGFRTSVPSRKPIAAANTSCGIVQAPMLDSIALGAFQPMIGPLMKLYGSRRGLVSRPLIPSRISCWNWARSMSVPVKWPQPQVFARVRARVIA